MRAADSARVVHLCAARCAPFIAHKWPTYALRLTQALDEINPERRVYINSVSPIVFALALYVLRITEL